MSFDGFAKDFAASTKTATPTPGNSEAFQDLNPFQQFVKSTASAVGPEMFGLKPLEGVQEFRDENPVAGMGSQFLGIAAPYGAVGALGKLPKVAGMLDAVGDANTIIGGAKRNAVLFGAGVEAPRIAGSIALGGDTGEVLANAGINTMLEMGFGGLGGYFRAAGKVDKNLAKLGASVDLKQPPQVLAQDIRKALDEGKIAEADVPTANNMLSTIHDSILNSTLDGDLAEKYIKPLDDGDSQPINRLFKYSSMPNKSPISKKLLVPSQFDDVQELDSLLTSSGIKDNVSYVQHPRFITSADDNGAKAIEASLKQGGMKSVGENTLLNREKDGLYVVAKKVQGDVGIASTDDKWVMFKTSAPERFSKTNAEWGKQVTDRNAWLEEAPRVADPANPLDIFDETSSLTQQIPINGFYQAKTGVGGKTIERLQKMAGLEGESEAMRRLKAGFRENFAPAMYEFKSNPRAQWVFAQAKNTFQKAESLAHAMTYGDEAVASGKGLYGKLIANATLSGKFGSKSAFAKILEPLSKEQVGELVSAADKGLEGKALTDAFAKGEISKPVFEALNAIKPLDDYLISQTQGTLAAADGGSFSPIRGHYLLPRTWKGTWRVPIKTANDKLVYMASGNTREEALREAASLVGTADTKGWKAGKAMTADSSDDVALSLQVAAGSPEYMTAASLKAKLNKDVKNPNSFKVRTGVGGYENSFTKDELISKFYNNVVARNRHMAELSVNKLLGEQIAKVGIEDPQLAKELTRRIDSMAGKQGSVSKMISTEVDKVFAPSLGKNSATKIANTINEVNHHLTLGALNMAFPTMNLMTFIQTVVPRIAFTLKATDESLMKAYSWLPLIGTDGKVRGSFGAVEPLKIMKQSFMEMGKPDAALSKNFSKALREGVVDPKFVEEWAGQNSNQILKLKGVLKGEEPFSGFLKSISNFLPNVTEKLSRGNAFTVGHIIGRDFFKLEDEALYRFAKEFTEKTMFNYTAADRPRVFTGPLGSVFGQFKNWSAHYIANMLEYAGEGFNYGNWSPLLWQMGGTTAIGGVSATALYPVADKFNQWLTDKSLMETLYERMGGGSGDSRLGNLTDGVFHGLPMFLGVSVTGQASDPLSDPSRTASMMFSFVQMQRANAVAKAIGQGIDNWAVTGEHPVNSEQTRDLLIAALAPKTLARFAAITEDQGIKSLNNGNKLYSGLNLPEKIMYESGFMPKRVALQQDVNEQLWQNQAELKAKITTYGRIWSEAEQAKDFEMLTELQRKALTEGVPIDSVIRSAKTQTRNAIIPQEDRKFKATDVMKFKNLGIVE